MEQFRNGEYVSSRVMQQTLVYIDMGWVMWCYWCIIRKYFTFILILILCSDATNISLHLYGVNYVVLLICGKEMDYLNIYTQLRIVCKIEIQQTIIFINTLAVTCTICAHAGLSRRAMVTNIFHAYKKNEVPYEQSRPMC